MQVFTLNAVGKKKARERQKERASERSIKGERNSRGMIHSPKADTMKGKRRREREGWKQRERERKCLEFSNVFFKNIHGWTDVHMSGWTDKWMVDERTDGQMDVHKDG